MAPFVVNCAAKVGPTRIAVTCVFDGMMALDEFVLAP